MKIAMLTSDYLPNIGGIASHIYELSKALMGEGHEVEIWFWDRKGLGPLEKEMGDIPLRIIGADIAQGRFGTKTKLAKEIKSFLRDFRPDVIHIHTLDKLIPAVFSLKKKYSIKVVWTNHTSRYLRKINSLPFKFKMLYYARSFDGLVAASKERLKKSLCLGLPEENCIYIPNGVDLSKFKYLTKSEARRELGIPEGNFTLLYTGRFAPIKGVTYLAEAIYNLKSKIPDMVCLMCGNIEGDRESEKIRTFVEENNLTDIVRMEGFIPNEQLGPYLYACDALVLPSLMEATSISGLEAMSAGRPVIGSRVGGIPELVIDGVTGYLAAPGDCTDLASAIEKFWKASNKEEIGYNAQERIKNKFTWHKVATQTLDFYKKLLEK